MAISVKIVWEGCNNIIFFFPVILDLKALNVRVVIDFLSFSISKSVGLKVMAFHLPNTVYLEIMPQLYFCLFYSHQ